MIEMKSADMFHFGDNLAKEVIESRLAQDLKERGYTVVEADFERPWGGFLRISDEQADKFIHEFFDGVDLPQTMEGATLSPKFLFAEPGKKLSWQVHERRAEFWRVLKGPVGAYRSQTDEQPDKPEVFREGETIDLPIGVRHRLAGLDRLGVVAEIWIHTDPKNPSDEADIKRLADDFGRESN